MMPWLVCCSIVLLAAPCTAIQPDSAQRSPVEITPDGPEDAGRVEIGQVVSRKATIRNQSDRQLHLRVARTTCSCVSVEIASPALSAHGETTVEIVVAVTGGVGIQRHGAEIEVGPDDPGSDLTPYRATLAVSFEPDRVYDVRPTSI